MRGGRRGRQNKQTAAVNAYQAKIESEFEDWADKYSEDIASGDDNKTEIALGILLLLLIALGRKNLPDAVDLAVGNEAQTPEMVEHLLEVMRSNEEYITNSLIPDLRAKIQKALADPDIILAIQAGDGRDALRAVLATVSARVASYAGAYYNTYEYAKGLLIDTHGKEYRWNLDPAVINHCGDCLQYGDKTYPSFAAMLQQTGQKGPGINVSCLPNCRCDGQEM